MYALDLKNIVNKMDSLSKRASTQENLNTIWALAKRLDHTAYEAYAEEELTREEFYEYMDYVSEAKHYVKVCKQI